MQKTECRHRAKSEKLIVFLIVICLAVVFTSNGCVSDSGYILGQSIDNIALIEIYDISPTELTAAEEVIEKGQFITSIDAEKHNDFVSELKGLSYSGNFMDPYVTFNGMVIKITYKNGNIEIINANMSAYYDRSQWEYKLKIFNARQYEHFINQWIVVK